MNSWSTPTAGEVLQTEPHADQSVDPMPEQTEVPMMEIQVVQANRQTVATIDQFPKPTEEIKDLLRSSDWNEVNQGLELLA